MGFQLFTHADYGEAFLSAVAVALSDRDVPS
jgi:hypothetical protein